MKDLFVVAALIGTIGLASQARAQTFETASVRINLQGSAGGEKHPDESIAANPGTLSMKSVSLRTCVTWAYNVRDFQIVNEPSWFASERYDIAAKASGGANETDMKKMMQSLVAERFHLKLHEESRALPVYALVPAKSGAKLRPAAGKEPAGMRPRDGALEFRGVSMDDFAGRLSRRPLSLDRPAIDRTGLAGEYDFSLKFAGDAAGLKSSMEENDRSGGQSLFSALQEQLGLKLSPEKTPLRVLVIERADKIPTEN